MFNLKYLFEIQYMVGTQVLQRAYITATSETDIQTYAQKNNIQIIHQRTIASNLGDSLAKGNDISLLIDLSTTK